MNCLECRQIILADPYDAAADEHVATCQQCSGFRKEILSMDNDIARALDVPVPEGLAARVLLNQSLSSQPRSTIFVRYAMAASFAAALVFGAALVIGTGSDQPAQVAGIAPPPTTSPESANDASSLSSVEKVKAVMDKQKMMAHSQAAPGADPYAAHAAHQPHNFYGSDHQPIDDESLEQLMTKFQLTASLDHVVYAAICPFEGENAAHLVIKDGADQYTVMLLPDRSPGKMYTVDDTLWRGYVSPHPAGALAVLAEADDAEAVARIREVTDKVQTAIYLTAGF